jgi:p-methyltransferase
MNATRPLDCLIIGYNELPFDEYERILRTYGETSEAYRDLRFNFVDVGEEKLTYVDLLNAAAAAAAQEMEPGRRARRPFQSGDMPNLAAAYLTHYLRRRDLEADYVNLFQRETQRLEALLAADPLCVAITTTFYVLNQPVSEIVRFIRAHNRRTKIVVGGPLIANHHRRYEGAELQLALEDIGADFYVIESQGEHTLARIVRALREGGGLATVPNLAWIENGSLRRTATEPENNSLDEDYVDWRRLSDASLGPTLQSRTAKSCAFSCAFCAYPIRAGRLTLAHLDTIEKELDSMRALGGVRNVVFIDDTFNVPLKRFKEICRLMIEKDYGFSWFSYFRCSNADGEAVELMARSGCRGVFLGVESGSPSVLRKMNKAATVEQYERGIRMLQQHGILTFGSFIFGFPGETTETVQETIDFIRRTVMDYYRIQLWYCEAGTPVYDRREELGITGQGFRWHHATMSSSEAMDHIERAFLSIRESEWLPQWSFDFWIIPYLLGRGVSLEQFRTFMQQANRMLELEFGDVPTARKVERQRTRLECLVGSLSFAGVPGAAQSEVQPWT